MENFNELMELLPTHPSLHPIHRHFFSMIRNRGGDCLGFKRLIVLQMIETGLQLKYGLGGP